MTPEESKTFLDYFEKVRGRTKRVVQVIPAEKIDWRPQQGLFTLGDLVRHLAAIERFMYAENVQGRPGRYVGCGKEYGESLSAVIEFMDTCHKESMEVFRALSPEQWNGKCNTAAGTPITVWKWLRLMAEHEIHHRGQIYTFLAMAGETTPPLYGLTSEEVAERGKQSSG